MALLLRDFVTTTLAMAPAGTTGTSLTVQAGGGALFPTVSGGNVMPAVIEAADGSAREAVMVTGRTGDSFAITRSASPVAWSGSGQVFYLTLTAAAFDELNKASNHSVVPAGGITATSVQAALEEVSRSVADSAASLGTSVSAVAASLAALDTQVVKLSGEQTIAGAKTFSSTPAVPAGTSPSHAVNLSQLQSATQPASESVAGVIEIATSAEAQAFAANKAIDGAKLADAFKGGNQSLGASALRQAFPGGLQIKSGESINTAGGYGAVSVTFPSAFPNACVFVDPVYENASGANLFAPVVLSRSATGFSVYCALINFRWFAVGY